MRLFCWAVTTINASIYHKFMYNYPMLCKLLRWLPAVFIMATIFIASNTPGQTLVSAGLGGWSLRKTLHLLGYALLGASYVFALRPKTWRGFLLAWGLAVLYAISDETHQRFVPGRGGIFLLDVGIDSLGAGLAVWMYAWLKRKIPILQE
jgi:hypothetical protein